ncbi:uncharacterized protein LOC123553385 [Mercenaria mercenaria]|uniref:uncharacterized protein LOC123553385 n=1 Tax=Mercenaria mercenaria TaxID=6596 RepID=UPI00234E44E4|nr:uncharacterized protein LOC123553385 [Mercenaria mercenaria]
MNVMLLRGVVVVTIALVVAIVAAALPYWWTTSPFAGTDGISSDVGLFKTCSEIKLSAHIKTGSKSCTENTDAASWLRGVQACVVISIILVAVSLALAAIYYCIFTNIPVLALVIATLNFIAGSLLEIGAIVFLVMILKEAGFRFGVGIPHVSFYLALVAGGMLTSGGRILYKSRLQNAVGQALTTPRDTTFALTAVNTQSHSTPGNFNLAMGTNVPGHAVEEYWRGGGSEGAYPIIHTRPAHVKQNHYMNMNGTNEI